MTKSERQRVRDRGETAMQQLNNPLIHYTRRGTD